MKRLYVKPSCRGLSIGRELAEKLITLAMYHGYRKMKPDTMDTMALAIGPVQKSWLP